MVAKEYRKNLVSKKVSDSVSLNLISEKVLDSVFVQILGILGDVLVLKLLGLETVSFYRWY